MRDSNQCICCGDHPSRHDIGAIYDGSGRELWLCHTCLENAREELHRFQGHGAQSAGMMPEILDSDTVTPEQFNRFLWLLAENSGALYLEDEEEVKALGFVPEHGLYRFPMALEVVGFTYWQWDGDKLAHACHQGSLSNYLSHQTPQANQNPS